jgi:hypothetical protein
MEGAASAPLAPEAVLELDSPIGDLGAELDELGEHGTAPEGHGVEVAHHHSLRGMISMG